MRNRFDEQLAQLNRELIEMGALCEEVIALAAQGADGGGHGAGRQGGASGQRRSTRRSGTSKTCA